MVAPDRCPLTATVVPTGNWAAVAGAAAVPNLVVGETMTVIVFCLAVTTVQDEPASAVICPRTPWLVPVDGGAGCDAGADVVAVEAVVPESRVSAMPTAAPAAIATRTAPVPMAHRRARPVCRGGTGLRYGACDDVSAVRGICDVSSVR
jgi:hypothetical protein